MLRYVIFIRLLFLLPVIVSKTANAAPMGYPDVPHFGYQTHYQAVWNLFDGQIDEILWQETGEPEDAKSKEVFIVQQAGKNWFVKIVPIDFDDPPLNHFEYEWELKTQLADKNPLAAVGGEITFADRGAFYTNSMEQCYVARYPLVPGKTIRALADHYMSTKDFKDFDILTAAVYRYAQVSAYLHFDPEDPPKEGEDILERPVRFFLDDRNSRNEIYDYATDTVYLIDYPPFHSHYNMSIPVKNYLVKSFGAALGGIIDDGRNLHLLYKTFILGYVLALPKYDSLDLRDTLYKYIDRLAEAQKERRGN